MSELRIIVPLKSIEYGFGYITMRSPYTPDFMYLRGTIVVAGPTAPAKQVRNSVLPAERLKWIE